MLESDGVTIRREELGGSGGGLCKVKGRDIFFLDTQAPSTETSALCADAVVQRIDVEQVYIRPEVRQFIGKHTHSVKE